MFSGICVGGPWHGQNFVYFKNRAELETFNNFHKEWQGVYVLEDIEWKWYGVNDC